MQHNKKITTRFAIQIFSALLFLALVACANRARGPQGGPRDITPPQPAKAKPQNGTVNFKGKSIEISFSEYITLKSQNNIVVSPPQVSPANIYSNGKKIYVTLNDTLKDNTTYTIDFENSIADLNENNTLNGYSFSFATGPTLDTLQIAGTVLDASNLNPVADIIVGIYANVNDSTFQKTMPLRVAKTDNAGKFCIKNVKAGSYHIVALNDLNSDYKYNDPNEQIAFADAVVTPSAEVKTVMDTLKLQPEKHHAKAHKAQTDTVKKYVIKPVQKTTFYPNNLVLKAFKKDVYNQYCQKTQRTEPYKVTFFFNTYNKEKPQVRPLNFTPSRADLIQYSAKNDTVTYWVADSATFKTDTLKFALDYKKAGKFTGSIINTTDTVSAVSFQKNAKKGKKSKRKAVISVPKFLPITTNLQDPFDMYSPVQIISDQPIKSIDSKKIHLFAKKDSVWNPLTIQLQKVDTLGLVYSFTNPWDSEMDYRLLIDSASIVGLYNTCNDKLELPFKVKAANLYSTLTVTLINPNDKAVIQLLDAKDNVVKQLPVKGKGTTFEHLLPGDYYLRLFIDANQNGQWDVGDYEAKRQPEEVYYFNDALHLRSNWEFEQEWDYLATPLPNQKPAPLVKTK